MEKRKDRIYLCLAHMSEAGVEQKYIQEAFDTNWVVPLGPNVNGFEHDLEAFVNGFKIQDSGFKIQDSGFKIQDSGFKIQDSGFKIQDSGFKIQDSRPETWNLKPETLSKRVVALSSGTAAVHLALIACGVGPGDEVCVQSFTFCASSHPITYLGATPVFIDSEKDTWNMDPELLEAAIKDRIAKTGKKPKAIVPVALYGMPYRIDRIMEIADRYGIPVVEDAAEGFGSRFNGQVLGTFGKYGVLSFNGNKMITTSGGGALVTEDEAHWREIMMYATQYRESYPYYQHEKIGYNYRMSNICAGIGRGQMTVADAHIEHHKHVQKLYEELLANVPGVHVHSQPDSGFRFQDSGFRIQDSGFRIQDSSDVKPETAEGVKPETRVFDSNYWLCTITIDPEVKVKGQENAYKAIVTGAVGGAAGVIHAAESAHTDCEPNANVEAMRMGLDAMNIEARPLWKPMHCQPVYKDAPAYLNGVSEALFKVGMCLPAGPYVKDEDVRYIVEAIKSLL